MTTQTEFQPFTTMDIPEIGRILQIHNAEARLPVAVLPDRVSLTASWRRRFGATWRQFSLDHDGGIITFPDKPGDGGPSLRVVLAWLETNGYRLATAPDDPQAEYVRS
jgi:hypothetical protein